MTEREGQTGRMDDLGESPVTAERVRALLRAQARPADSLGRLEDLAVEVALAAGSVQPVTRPRRAVLFAADHGAVAGGVSAWPSAVTGAMVATIAGGRATSSALAGATGCELRLVDVGTLAPLGRPDSAAYAERPVAKGSADLAHGPALSVAQHRAAWQVGATEARAALAEGHRLLVVGEMGIGSTTSAACLTALLAGEGDDLDDLDDLVREVVGPGAGADDDLLTRKRAVVRAAVSRARDLADPERAIAEVGGLEISAMAGCLAAGGAGGALLLLDGYVATAAALVVRRLDPTTPRRLVAAHRSAEPGHGRALAALGLEPVLEWQMRLGEGTGALACLGLVDAAAALLGDIATLDEVVG